MKKIRWSTLSNTDEETAANRVTIRGEPKPDLKVSVVEKKNGETIKINRFIDINLDQHEILIAPSFQWEVTDFEATNSNNIEYTIKRADNCWEADQKEGKLIIKPGKKDEFKQARKEMHKNLLEKEFGDKIDLSTRTDAEGADIKYIIMKDGAGYKVRIYWADKNNDKEFPWEQVNIEPNYWQNQAVDFDNLFNVEYQEEEKNSQWTTSWIVFFVVLTVIMVLIVVFWKKIWKWIKGEREQEKKVKEQLDIF